MEAASHPILSSEEARRFEKALFGGDEAAEWKAMQRAGRAIAQAILRDVREIGGLRAAPRVLVLAGKGHNAGDALIAARLILETVPDATADVVFVFGERTLRPLARQAWIDLSNRCAWRARPHSGAGASRIAEFFGANRDFDVSLDGVFGGSWRPPLPANASAVLRQSNQLSVRFRAAVDLPSGLNEPDAFRADFTYATGIVKSELLTCGNAGRIRYLDLGFFEPGAAGATPPGADEPADRDRVIVPGVLGELCRLRVSQSDKRDYGHLYLVGGSRRCPGAILMSVLAALKSGVGLVTACVPDTLVAPFASRAPEAMWVGLPEAPGGGLAPEALPVLGEHWGRASAVLAGPGMGRSAGTQALLLGIVKTAAVPLVLDADALLPDVVREARLPRILTPHVGEFARIAQGGNLKGFCSETGATVVLKGSVTCVASAAAPMSFSFYGGPVLSRGGSGDVLSGLIGGLLAQSPGDPTLAASRGAVWHGLAADALARAHGQTSARVTELMDHLPGVLRTIATCPAAG